MPDLAAHPDVAEGPLPGMDAQGEMGASTGINIEPGSEDDGWVVPDPVPMGDGSIVQLYKDGEALHAWYEAIKAARSRVCLEMYIFAGDETGRAFADLLCEKAAAGLKVYVVFDSFGSIATPNAMFEKMRKAGVRVQEFHPFWPWEGKSSWRPVNRDHRKLLVCDNDFAGLGGLNLAGEYAGSWVVKSSKADLELWRDAGITVRGPAAGRFAQAFARTWQYVTRRGKMRHAEFVYNLDGVCGACEWPLVARRKRGVVKHGEEPERPGKFGILASAPTLHSPLRPFLN
jgi:hypothetical protein